MSNQSDILSYNPDLEIRSKITSDTSGIDYEDSVNNTTESTDVNKSISVREFEYQLPSKKVIDATRLIDRIKGYLSTIESNITGEYANTYFSSNDEEKKQEVLVSNKIDLEHGSTPLEVYTILEKISTEVKSILNLFITCMFGKDVDVDSVTELVNAYVDKINQFESSSQHEKVNYFGLYYDTQISFLFGEYVRKMDEISADLSFISDKQRNLTMDKVNTDLFKNSFDRLNKVLDNDIYKDSDTSGDISTSMKNIFLIKQKINSYLEIFSTLYTLDDGVDEIKEIKQENIDDLETKLDNLIKTMQYSNLAKKDIRETLQKKSNYRSFFVT